MAATRGQTIDTDQAKAICNLDDGDISTLRCTYAIDIESVDDLALLDKADIDTILGTDTATFVKRRRLWALVQFVKAGGVLTDTTTLSDLHALVIPTPISKTISFAILFATIFNVFFVLGYWTGDVIS